MAEPAKAGDQISLARAALASARAAAQAKGLRPSAPVHRPADEDDDGSGQPAAAAQPGQDDAAPDRRIPAQPGHARASRPGRQRREDPERLGAAIDGLLTAQGWALAAATGSVFGRWDQIVGADLAAHTTPESLTDGELTVAADSTAWATQVRLLAGQLVRRLNAELGDRTVQRVKVRGPVTVNSKPGEWRVRGSRGPRDTYG